jgi:hypothetical protein
VFAIASLPSIPQLLYLVSHRGGLGAFITPATLDESVSRFHLLRYVVIPLAFAVCAGYALREAWPDQATPVPSCLSMLVLWLFLPLIAAWVFARAKFVNINVDRYLIACSVASVLLSVTAIQFACTARARVWTYAFLILSTSCFSYVTIRDVGTIRASQSWRDLVARVNESGPRDLPVYFESTLTEARWLSTRGDELFREYLLSPVNSAYRLRADLLGSARPIIDTWSLREVAKASDFVFIGHVSALDSLRQVAATMAERSNKTYDIQFIFGGQSTPWQFMAVEVRFRSHESRPNNLSATRDFTPWQFMAVEVRFRSHESRPNNLSATRDFD